MIRSRVLIVEDESDIRRFVRMALEQEGLDTCEASTAREARMYASSSKPDLVIVDLGLPDDDGKTFIRELREWSTVPVIVLSARQQEVEKVAARQQKERPASDVLIQELDGAPAPAATPAAGH